MNSLRLTLWQVRYTNKAYWRNPAAAFFTFLFPLMFLVIFTALLGHGHIVLSGHRISLSTYYVAAMASFAVISASYVNLGIGVTFQRDSGILKRIGGSPLSGWAYLTARVIHAMLMAVLLVIITAVFGRAFYGAAVPAGKDLVFFVVMLVVGSASFCALGLAVTAPIPNAEAATAIVNATMLPLLFLSGVFIPIGDHAPAWIQWIGRVFPVKHFADGLQAGFVGSAFHWNGVLIVAAWGVAGLLIAARYFRWEPSR
jgi:ABC-2 type transport system permease protein